MAVGLVPVIWKLPWASGARVSFAVELAWFRRSDAVPWHAAWHCSSAVTWRPLSNATAGSTIGRTALPHVVPPRAPLAPGGPGTPPGAPEAPPAPGAPIVSIVSAERITDDPESAR